MRFFTFVRGRLITVDNSMDAFDSFLFYYCKVHGIDFDSLSIEDHNYAFDHWVEGLILSRQLHISDDKGRLFDQFVVEEEVFWQDVTQDMLDQMTWGDLDG